MGIGDKMRGLGNNVQDGIKTSSASLAHVLLRVLTGCLLGLTLALIGQELMGYETLALLFCTVVVLALVFKLLSNWSLVQILIFDLICILVAMLLRMYILVAP